MCFENTRFLWIIEKQRLKGIGSTRRQRRQWSASLRPKNAAASTEPPWAREHRKLPKRFNGTVAGGNTATPKARTTTYYSPLLFLLKLALEWVWMHHFVNQAYVNTSSIVAHRRYASALFCLMPRMNEGIDTHFHRRSFHRASYLVIDIRMSHHKSDGLPSDHSHKSFVIGGLGMLAQRVYFLTHKSAELDNQLFSATSILFRGERQKDREC